MSVVLASFIIPVDITFQFSKFFVKKLGFQRNFICRNSCFLFSRTRNQGMIDSIRTYGSTGENGVQALEQETFIERSSNSGAVGLESTLNSLSKWLVATLFGAIVLWRHDAESLWALMGSVLNAIISITLKKILNQERPVSTLRSDPGMPSSHAQSIFYTVGFVNLSMAEWYGINGLTATLCGLVFMLGCYFSWLRVSQQLHTASQVIVGAALGYTFSILWLYSWKAFVVKAFISYLWIRIFVVMGAVGFALGFIRHIYSTWLLDEN